MKKTIHVAQVISEGGRTGKVETDTGSLSVVLGQGTSAVTPEHLFAGAYGACFLSAVLSAAERSHHKVVGATLTTQVTLEEDEAGGYSLRVLHRAALPNLAESEARHLLHLAHQSCPYSKATRGNVVVTLETD